MSSTFNNDFKGPIENLTQGDGNTININKLNNQQQFQNLVRDLRGEVSSLPEDQRQASMCHVEVIEGELVTEPKSKSKIQQSLEALHDISSVAGTVKAILDLLPMLI